MIAKECVWLIPGKVRWHGKKPENNVYEEFVGYINHYSNIILTLHSVQFVDIMADLTLTKDTLRLAMEETLSPEMEWQNESMKKKAEAKQEMINKLVETAEKVY